VTARASTFAANYKAARDRRFTCECSSGDCSGGGASDDRTAAAAAAAALRVTERQYLRRRVQGRAGQALHLRVQQRRLRPGHAGAVAAAPAGGRRPQPRRLARLASAVQGASHRYCHSAIGSAQVVPLAIGSSKVTPTWCAYRRMRFPTSLHGNTTRATTSRMRGLPDCAPLSSPNIWLDDLQTPATTSCYRRAAKTARPPRRAARSRPTKPRRGPPRASFRRAASPRTQRGEGCQPPLHRRDLTRTSSTGTAPTAHPLADTRSARRRGPAARRPAGRFGEPLPISRAGSRPTGPHTSTRNEGASCDANIPHLPARTLSPAGNDESRRLSDDEAAADDSLRTTRPIEWPASLAPALLNLCRRTFNEDNNGLRVHDMKLAV
jgi:hypothetical protein